jgi:CotH kinase protein
MKKILVFLFFVQFAAAQTLTETNLPIVILSSAGQPIGFDIPVKIGLKIIENGANLPNHPTDLPIYQGAISIKIRGNYSAILPQKPYAFETLNANSTADSSVSLLGFPEESDWILLANWNDKTFLRNAMMFDIARSMGHYATRSRHVEVLLDGEYQGIYLFCEKIKRDANRLKIKKLQPSDDDFPKITGGYIFRHDYEADWETENWQPQNCPDRKLNFELIYPKIDSISTAQFDYLKSYLDSFERALFAPDFNNLAGGWRQFADEKTWVDYLVLNEFAQNGDGFKKSMYFHKNRGEKLKLGPIWDFDWALKFFPWFSPNVNNWMFAQNPCDNDILLVPYFVRLMEDDAFVEAVKCRWTTLREGVLSTQNLTFYIDSVVGKLDAAKTRHFQKWNCLGYDSGAPENPPYPTTFVGEISKFELFLQKRIVFLDVHWFSNSCLSDAQIIDNQRFNLYPNPSDGRFFMKNLPDANRFKIYDSFGRLVLEQRIYDKKWFAIELPAGNSGVFWVDFLDNSGQKVGESRRILVF